MTALVVPFDYIQAAKRVQHFQEQLLDFQEGHDKKYLSQYPACLLVWLHALGWAPHDDRVLIEALPYFKDHLDLLDVRNVMANLNYQTVELSLPLVQLNAQLLPCLAVIDHSHIMVVLEKIGSRWRIYDGKELEEKVIDGLPGKITFFHAFVAPEMLPGAQSRIPWLSMLWQRFKPLIYKIMITTFISNVLAMLVPLFILMVYDKVIGNNAPAMLIYLLVGVIGSLILDAYIRSLRVAALSYVGARVDYLMGVMTFRQLLGLPLSMTESASVGQQLAKLRDFESLRDFLTSSLMGALLDLPFVLFFLVFIAIIAGNLVIVPAIMMGVFIIIGLAMIPPIRRQVREGGEARVKRQNVLMEILGNLRLIKLYSLEKQWLQKFRDLSASVGLSQLRTSSLISLSSIFAGLTLAIAGVITIVVGANKVINGQMTTGALIATMILVWRVLGPLQTIFGSLNRFDQLSVTVKQINNFLSIKTEQNTGIEKAQKGLDIEHPIQEGSVGFAHVSFRYQQSVLPALLGVNLNIKAGECVALIGPNGCGKSTMLRLVAGLYIPQAGSILLDGQDTRQLSPDIIRSAVGYVPQSGNLFYGTIAQNLRLSVPAARDDDLFEACRMAGILDMILDLPEGFETRITDYAPTNFPPGLQQGIVIARAYLRKPKILLLDEAARTLDDQLDQALQASIKLFKGKTTVIQATNRPSHIKLADRVIVLYQGRLLREGSPDAILQEGLDKATGGVRR